MSKKTIAKFCGFVILPMLVAGLFAGCHDNDRPTIGEAASAYHPPMVVGTLKSDEITESSGLAASKCQPNVFWTHNDSGDGPYIYAIDTTGANLGVWKVQNAENTDWEDIAAFRDSTGQCYLYIGEIGNSEKAERSDHRIYRIKEPAVSAADASRRQNEAPLTEPASVLAFRYADAKHDAETLIVHPTTGDIYIFTKHRSKPSSVYKLLAASAQNGATAQKIAELAVPAVPYGFLTGGSISSDGLRVVLCDYAGAYELVLSDTSVNFDEIWKQKPVAIDLGSRKQGEAVAYSPDGMSIFATSERRNAPIIQVQRK